MHSALLGKSHDCVDNNSICIYLCGDSFSRVVLASFWLISRNHSKQSRDVPKKLFLRL